MNDAPESLASLCQHLRRMSEGAVEAIDADRLWRAANTIEELANEEVRAAAPVVAVKPGECEWCVDGLQADSETPCPCQDTPANPLAMLKAAILDAQIRAFEQGRLDTPDEITANALAAIEAKP